MAIATWTTAAGVSGSVELTRLPGAPLAPWRYRGLVRLRGYKAAEFEIASNGTLVIRWGHIPPEEEKSVRSLCTHAIDGEMRAYFGAGMY